MISGTELNLEMTKAAMSSRLAPMKESARSVAVALALRSEKTGDFVPSMNGVSPGELLSVQTPGSARESGRGSSLCSGCYRRMGESFRRWWRGNRPGTKGRWVRIQWRRGHTREEDTPRRVRGL